MVEHVDPSRSAQELPTSFLLAQRAASGDSAATSALVTMVSPKMTRAVRLVLGTQQADADDVMQQALIAFIQALPAFRGECEPASYACRIAVRLAIATRQRVRKSVGRAAGPHELDALVGDSSPSEDAEARRRKEVLRQLLDELPDEQAEALVLRTVLGWTLEEIAASARAPVNTIRSRLRLAKEALRKKIESMPELADGLGVMP